MVKKIIDKASAALLILCFLGLLYSGMIATIKEEHEEFSYFENRNLAEFPKYSRQALIDGSYTSGLENWLNDFAAYREPLLKLQTLADIKIFKRPMINEVIINDDLLLPWKEFESVDGNKILSLADMMSERLKSHSDVTKKNGGNFYYISIPCQYVCFEDSYPKFTNNRKAYTNASKSAMFEKLSEKGVNYVDMKEKYEAAGGSEKFSSKVDNHFNIMGAYQTYLAIMECVKKHYPNIDVLEKNEYAIEELPNPYLGSRGRKLFGLLDSKEKMSIISPLKYIPFERTNNGFKGAPIVYQLPESDKENILYSLYMGGDFGETIIDTNRRKLPSILVYGDSFTNGVESLIWYSFDKMISLDFRHYDKMTLDEYIEKEKPDIVVCIRDYEAMLLPEANGQ